MPEKKSIAATMKSIFHAAAASSPESKFRWAEYLLIAVAALNQLGWKRFGDDTVMISVVIPILLLLVLAVVNSLPLASSNGRRFAQILGEFALIAAASF